MSVGSSLNFQKTRGEKCESVPVWSTLPELKSVFLVVQVRPLHILNTINKTHFFINKVPKRSVGVQTSDMFCLYFIQRYRFLYT